MKTKITIVILSILIVILLFKDCGSKSDNSASVENTQAEKKLKTEILNLKQDQQKRKDTIIYKDSIVYHYHDKWKVIRHDSLIPCPEKLLIADTVIYQDSSLIYSLRDYISKDSVLISKQDGLIKMDSIVIKSMGIEIKKLKRSKAFWKFLFGISLVGNGVQAIRP